MAAEAHRKDPDKSRPVPKSAKAQLGCGRQACDPIDKQILVVVLVVHIA